MKTDLQDSHFISSTTAAHKKERSAYEAINMSEIPLAFNNSNQQ